MIPAANQFVRVFALACNGHCEHKHPASPVVVLGSRIIKHSATNVRTYVRGFAGGRDEWEFDIKKFRFEGIENEKE